MRRSEVYRKAVELWGESGQLLMVIEECSELSKALCKYFRRSDTRTFDDIVEEMADVEIMLSQMKYMLGADGRKLFYAAKGRKIRRLEKRMREHEAEHEEREREVS